MLDFLPPKQKRYFIYLLAGFLPLGTFYFIIYLFGDVFYGIAFALILGFLGLFLLHKVVMNPLAIMVEDGLPMLFTYESRGVVMASNVMVHPVEPIVEGVVGGRRFTMAYSRDTIFDLVFHKAPVHQWMDSTHVILAIPKEIYYNTQFLFGSAKVMFFNRQLGVLMTKDMLKDQEESKLIELLLVSLKREAVRLSDITERYSQTAIDAFMNRFKIQNYFIFIVIAFVLIVGIVFWPQISSFIGIGAQATQGIVLPTEAITAVG